MKRRLYNALQQGDTIVEVMISMAVLAVVLGATYAISTRSFQSGLNAQYRDQAVSYGQQQVELIREADNNNPTTISTYSTPADSAFCIDPNTKSRLTGSNCVFGNLYTVNAQYRSASHSFQVTTSWDSASSVKQQIVMYYKSNDSFVGPPVACTAESDTCAGTITNPPAVNISALNNPSDTGESNTIHWDIANVAAGSCVPTGPGGFSGANVNTASGDFNINPLPPGNHIFSISCTDNSGNPVQGSTTVNVVNLVATVDLTADSANLPFGGSTTLRWTATNLSGGSCTASNGANGWAGSRGLTGTFNTGSLTSTTSYDITCTAGGGRTASDTQVIKVSLPVSPPTVTTGGAVHETRAGVSNSSAWDLSGTVNPNNGSTNCFFLWDNDSDLTSGEHITNCGSAVGSGNSNVGVGTVIDLDDYYRGTPSGTTFFYQLCASNPAGTTCGSVRNFDST
jgi:Tfp pilus assembly protein PilV